MATTFDSADDQAGAVAAMLIENRQKLETWREDSEVDQFGLTSDRPNDVHVHGFERIPGGGGFNPLSDDDLL